MEIDIAKPITIAHEATDDPIVAKQWLDSLDSTFAADFEVATRYTDKERKLLEQEDSVTSRQALRATALDHPYHCVITHFSFATSADTGKVIICSSSEIRDLVLDFLTETELTQVWHNASYDFKHIYFNTRKFPKVYEDTQILAKTLINNVDVFKAKTGLKELAGYKYGAWAVSSDYFTIDEMYNEDLLKYACIDAAATYWLWEELQRRFDG